MSALFLSLSGSGLATVTSRSPELRTILRNLWPPRGSARRRGYTARAVNEAASARVGRYKLRHQELLGPSHIVAGLCLTKTLVQA